MTEEFEDPRKADLRERATAAVDAAGYTVDPSRPVVAHPPASGLKGGMRGDVVATGNAGVKALYFIRVDGTKPLPQWLVNHVKASFSLQKVEVYIVVETVGPQLRGTCEASGAGLLRLRDDGTFEKELSYKAPDESADRKRFQARVKTLRTRLDSKLRLNQSKLETSFEESSAVTATMTSARRTEYLTDIENAMVMWRTWAEEKSQRLDALAGSETSAALEALEAEILRGPSGVPA